MGYDTSKPLSNEEYSSIIRTCIAERYAKVFPKKNVKVPDAQIGQREYELKQIISYRVSKGESNSDIAAFLEKNGYKIPSSDGAQQKSEESWTAKQVGQLKPKKK
ncbi:hypothetical protein VSVS12_04203 [Vibrio scophthalmi]|nr:hypothetical protein VSVS12_04203 [Vibrio scophthalmi]